VERDGQTIHFQKAASEGVMQCVREHTEIYIEVSGIHAWWEHAKSCKTQYKIRHLFHREYGMTEFHIGDIQTGAWCLLGNPLPSETEVLCLRQRTIRSAGCPRVAPVIMHNLRTTGG
jgi:hypothetical protein